MALTQKDLQAIAELLQPIQEDIRELNRRTGAVEEAVSQLNRRTGAVEEAVSQLNRRATSIELTLENETNRNIRIIAEGHRDLSRKLDDALKVENEKELLLVRVNLLEGELRKVKERLAEIA